MTLNAGNSWTATIDDLPKFVGDTREEIEYIWTEPSVDGYNLTSVDTEGTVTTFTNTRESGDLTVEKYLVSELAADADVEFKFVVTLNDTTINGNYGDMTFKDGVAEFTLKGGERATAEDLPANVEYEVKEIAADGFEVAYRSYFWRDVLLPR